MLLSNVKYGPQKNVGQMSGLAVSRHRVWA